MIAMTLALSGFTFLSAFHADAVQEDARRAVEPSALSTDLQREQRGLWLAQVHKGRMSLEIRPADRKNSHWGQTIELASPQLQGLTFGSEVEFRLVREPGSITFTGDLRGDAERADGTGRFVFRADPSFVEGMAELGYRDLSGHDLFQLALFDMTQGFVRGLRELGYRVSFQELLKMAIHGASPDYIRRLKAAGYSGLDVDLLVSMCIHDVEPEYAERMSRIAGSLIPARELVGLKIHDVDPEFAAEIRQLGYDDLDVDTLQSLRIHDVSPAFIRDAGQALREPVPLETLISFAIHDVDGPFLTDMLSRFTEVEAEELIEMRIHGVSASLLDELAQLGYGDLTVAQAVKMRIHQVTPEYVRGLHAKGITNLTVEELVSRRIHGEDD